MNPRDFVVKKQQLWAARKGIRLGSQFRHSDDQFQQQRGEKFFVYNLDDNLFEPLLPQIRKEFESGDGGELSCNSNEGNMYALHSSSALVCNVFHYWRRIESFEVLASAIGIPRRRIERIAFEQKCPISSSFPRDPNLDVLFVYQGKSNPKHVGIESKFVEPFGRRHAGMKKAYLEETSLWNGLANLFHLAEQISPDDNYFHYLNGAQLIKHILGLRNLSEGNNFRLLYIYYAVPGSEGETHEQEIEDFRSTALKDGIRVQSITYQQLLVNLATTSRGEHPEIIDYLVERYL